MTATDVLVELHTLKPGPGLAVPAIIRGIEACMADRAAFTPDDLAAALQQLRHRCLPLPLMQRCLEFMCRWLCVKARTPVIVTRSMCSPPVFLCRKQWTERSWLLWKQT